MICGPHMISSYDLTLRLRPGALSSAEEAKDFRSCVETNIRDRLAEGVNLLIYTEIYLYTQGHFREIKATLGPD